MLALVQWPSHRLPCQRYTALYLIYIYPILTPKWTFCHYPDKPKWQMSVDHKFIFSSPLPPNQLILLTFRYLSAYVLSPISPWHDGEKVADMMSDDNKKTYHN